MLGLLLLLLLLLARVTYNQVQELQVNTYRINFLQIIFSQIQLYIYEFYRVFPMQIQDCSLAVY